MISRFNLLGIFIISNMVVSILNLLFTLPFSFLISVATTAGALPYLIHLIIKWWRAPGQMKVSLDKMVIEEEI